MWLIGLPFNVYGGAEWNLYFGRIQITPQAAIGTGFIIPWLIETRDPAVTHVGGMLNVTVSYLVNQNMKITASGGVKYWYGIYDPLADWILKASTSYGGAYVSAGATLKL